MAVATVNLTFRDELLERMDEVARDEERSLSELAYRSIEQYIRRKQKLHSLYEYGERLAAQNNIREDDVMNEVRAYRRSR
jgi:predicted transcriptional regulator